MRNLSLSLFVIYIVYITFSLSGCAYNKVEPEVSTVPVSYSKEVKPIIQSKCYQCHSSSPTDPNAAGIPPNSQFDDFTQFRNYATAPSNTNPSYTKVVGQIKHLDAPGMPYQLPKLSDAEIKTIESWIQQGAQNN